LWAREVSAMASDEWDRRAVVRVRRWMMAGEEEEDVDVEEAMKRLRASDPTHRRAMVDDMAMRCDEDGTGMRRGCRENQKTRPKRWITRWTTNDYEKCPSLVSLLFFSFPDSESMYPIASSSLALSPSLSGRSPLPFPVVVRVVPEREIGKCEHFVDDFSNFFRFFFQDTTTRSRRCDEIGRERRDRDGGATDGGRQGGRDSPTPQRKLIVHPTPSGHHLGI
jgi:hypothetical protein